MRVLLIEDEPSMVDMICRQLSPIAEEIRVAQNLREATDLGGKSPLFELAILDLTLPDSSPEDTLHYIPVLRAFNPDAAILVLTGSVDERMAQAAVVAGANAFRRKSDVSTQAELWAIVRDLIDGGKNSQQRAIAGLDVSTKLGDMLQ